MDKVHEVIIVEGKADLSQIKRYFDAIVIEVGGLGLREEALKKLEVLGSYLPLVALLDPDGPGEKIGQRLKQRFPKLRLIVIGKKGLRSKNRKKLGIAYGSETRLKEALYLGGISLSLCPDYYNKGDLLFSIPQVTDKRILNLDKKNLIALANRLERGALWTLEQD